MSQDSIPIKYQLSKRHGVLTIFLLPWKNPITKATNNRKHLICDLQFQRVGVHDHYVKEHGTGEIVRAYILFTSTRQRANRKGHEFSKMIEARCPGNPKLNDVICFMVILEKCHFCVTLY